MSNRGPDPEISDGRLLVEMMLAHGPAVFASEIEERVPITRQRITQRLDSLEKQRLVVSKKASGRRLWWVTDSGKEKASELARDWIS